MTPDPPPNDSRLVHEWWRTWTPLIAVIVALFALVALPVLRTVQVHPMYQEMRTVTEPSRTLLTRVHAALALEQSLLRDFVEGGDSVARVRYANAVADEHQAYAELEPLARRLGPEVERDFNQLRDLERGWHAEVDKFLKRPSAQRFNRDPVHAKLYEEVLLSAARLDETLNATAASRRAAIEATNRAQVWVTLAVGFLALLAAAIVASLARRLRAFAVSEEQARKKLEEATDSRERLMRGVTHDLKNPLQAIWGNAELLDDGSAGPLNETQRRMVRRILSSGNHLLSMISDLLELSMAEGGTLQIRPVDTTLPDLVEETAAEFQRRAVESGLSLTVETQAVPPVVTDPQRVRQILQNLISNAVKYTPSGGAVSVSMALRSRPESSNNLAWVAVDVADTGRGIPLEKVDSIFEEFVRLESHRRVQGVGLGLAIARRVALLLGGDITLVTSSGGSIFTLWLPPQRRSLAAAK